MLTLKDIVQLDTKGQFRSDVQLSDYDNPSLNLALLQSYIFSASTPDSYGKRTRAIAALGLLDELRRAFTYDRFENRFVAIANYGHGKSHLALVLANLFARSYASEEVKTLLGRIDHAVDSPAKAQGYRDYKQERGEFLVMRLRGDTPRPLREQFFIALEQALSEHTQTCNEHPPFWTEAATRYLNNLSPEQLETANDFLRRFDQDVPALLQGISEYSEEAYERYVELFAHLNHGVRPSTEGNVSLREAVHWAVDKFCGRDKPLGGLLILFDEFSLYVQRYARTKAVGELQDLLQGVEDRQGKAIFLAFAQHDPDEVAEQTLHVGQALQSLKKELGRLPKRFALYSLMESVLDSYLKQSSTAWEEFLKDPKIKGAVFGQATETAWQTFLKHYDEELGWTYEQFREVVTQGCFPLHPMTTALLCQLKLQQGEDIGTARTALGFVRDQLDVRADEPAKTDGRVNWILPIALVDYFERRLVGDSPGLYAAYEKAQRDFEQVLGENATPVHRDVLKALLLQEIAGLPAAGRGQVDLLAQMSGHDERTTLQALKQLSSENAIRYDPVHRINSFWPLGADPQQLEKNIQEKIEETSFAHDELTRELNHLLQDEFYKFGSVALNVGWGHARDWAADERIVFPDNLTKETLHALLPPFRFTSRGWQDGKRGLVLWILLQDQADREMLRARVRAALAEAWPEDSPPPVLVMIPQEPNPGLIALFRRSKALEKIGKDKDLVKGIGQQTYDQEVQRTKAALGNALNQLRGGNSDHIWDIPRNLSEMVVPPACQAAVSALPSPTAKRVLEQLYPLAYRIRPPEFFTQYSATQARGSSKLRSAVKTVAKNLLYDRVGSARSGMDAVSKDLCEKYLASEWRLLTRQWDSLASAFALQKPMPPQLMPAWDLFDITFRPGVQDSKVAEIIPKLLNPPYGFDYNTATLLLCAWIGYHRIELRLSSRGEFIGLHQLEEQIDRAKTPKDFLAWACTNPLAITRRDPDADLQEMQAIRNRVLNREQFSQDEAETDLKRLEEFAAQEKQPADMRQRASKTAGKLRKGLEAAQKYDRAAQDILAPLNQERDIARLLALRSRLMKLPSSELVTITQPAPSEIEARLSQRIKAALDWERGRVQELKDITKLGAFRGKLDDLKNQLAQHGLTTFVKQVVAIEQALEERATFLKAQEQEGSIRNEIAAMASGAGLTELYRYRNRLGEIVGVSEQLEQVRSRKLDDVQREIQKLETFANKVTEQVYTIDLTRIGQERDQILRRLARFRDTELQAKLEQAIADLDMLQQFQDDLESVEKLPLRSPADVQVAQDELERIAQQFGQKVSEEHLAILHSVRNKIDDHERAEQQKAIEWLEALEREPEHGVSLNDLKRKLDHPPAFLPSDCQVRLEALCTRLQERLDQDYMAQIEELFRALGTPQRQQECLIRLQQIVTQDV